ncbi:hypothetical protein GLAREA_06173 [Glarea lozoyensis ATCC 20868]|uniref:DUF6594 domain-containing protein n=1 Tax=Glarea lozoyensis (strain ATCC 20868 / MF5171) TaxID=1116229 RepID=S3DM60_GLAL2|nr:uncharacterized protein GLAREA_06173 [Glarea lozoyensis ATCC 20868]EPE33161.1 hypothetical protein GLAREA_06173 [Glarea lozoyensis ATCC 20868]
MSSPQGSMPGADYPQLAHLMYRVPELAIFRSFRELTLLRLLSLQAELLELVEEYEASYEADLRGDSEQPTTHERQELSRSFRKLRESGPIESLQYEALDSIFKKVDEFYAAFIQASEMSKASKPEKGDLDHLRQWLSHPTVGGNFLPKSEDAWVKKYDADQITLIAKEGGLMRRSSSWIILIYDWVLGRHFVPDVIDSETGSRYYPTTLEKRIAKVTTSVIASLIPGLVILGLYFIDTTIKRIGTMLACTAVFAFVLSFWTQANVIDVFAATAAFAAVEVVFIGSAITNSTGV